ncbi:MAG: hypothetical protein QG673_2287 [Pseudomonadota bacterium]|nr:hypothetical protein [Pseudomonadota bacterium]
MKSGSIQNINPNYLLTNPSETQNVFDKVKKLIKSNSINDAVTCATNFINSPEVKVSEANDYYNDFKRIGLECGNREFVTELGTRLNIMDDAVISPKNIESTIKGENIQHIESNVDYQFNPNIHHPNVGMIQTKRGRGVCNLLSDGGILTCLHNIFDVNQYADHINEYYSEKEKICKSSNDDVMESWHEELKRYPSLYNKHKVESNQPKDNTIETTLKSNIWFMQVDDPVNQYFDDSIILRFFDNNHKLQSFEVKNISIGIMESTHITGLPLIQNNPRLQDVTWDFAILYFENQIDLKHILGTSGFVLKLNTNNVIEHRIINDSRTDGGGEEGKRYYPPYVRESMNDVSNKSFSSIDGYATTKLRYSNANLPGTSGAVILRSDLQNTIYSIIDSENTAIAALNIAININYIKSSKFTYNSNRYEGCNKDFGVVLIMDPLVLEPISKSNTEVVSAKNVSLNSLGAIILEKFDSHIADIVMSKKQYIKIEISPEGNNLNKVSLIIEIKTKYLAGIEFTFNKITTQLGINGLGEDYSNVRAEYPPDPRDNDWNFINAPFCENKLLELLEKTHKCNPAEKAKMQQKLFYYCIQIIEMAKLPVIAELVEKYQENQIEDFTKFYPIMTQIKRNYAKLSNIADGQLLNTQSTSGEKHDQLNEFVTKLSEHIFTKPGEKLNSFKTDILDPILSVLIKNYNSEFLPQYSDKIKQLFTPSINNNWYPVYLGKGNDVNKIGGRIPKNSHKNVTVVYPKEQEKEAKTICNNLKSKSSIEINNIKDVIVRVPYTNM